MNIEKELAKRGLSQTQVAAGIGITNSALSSWCTGRAKPCRKNEIRLKEFFRMHDREERHGQVQAVRKIKWQNKSVQDTPTTDPTSSGSNNFKKLVQAVLSVPCDSDTKILLLEDLCNQNI